MAFTKLLVLKLFIDDTDIYFIILSLFRKSDKIKFKFQDNKEQIFHNREISEQISLYSGDHSSH